MKLINFKILPFMLSGFTLLALNGCDGTTGTSSDSGIMHGNNIASDNVAPIITEDPSIASVSSLDGNISLTADEDVTVGLYVDGVLIDTTFDLMKDVSGILTVKVQDTLIAPSEGQIIIKDAAGNEAVSTTTVGLGTSGNDTLTGDSNSNLIFGFDGNDTLKASGGSDSLIGGDGNDYFDVDEGRADISLVADTLVDGGNGTDEIYVWNGAGALALTDADFANVKNMELLSVAAIAGSTVTLGDNTNAAFPTGIIMKHGHSSALTVNGELSTVDINVTGTPSNDVLTGGAGDDVFIGSTGADILTGGAGADRMDVGADNAIDTVDLSVLSESVVSTGNNISGNVSVGDIINYANGIDVIDNFDALDKDFIDVSTVDGPHAVLETQYGTSWAFLSGANYYLSGNFDEATGAFTVTANGAGSDTLLIQGEGGGDTFSNNDSSVILLGVNSDDLTTDDFI